VIGHLVYFYINLFPMFHYILHCVSANLWNFYTNNILIGSYIRSWERPGDLPRVYILISSNTTLRYMFAQGRKDGWTNADHYYVTPSLRGEGSLVRRSVCPNVGHPYVWILLILVWINVYIQPVCPFRYFVVLYLFSSNTTIRYMFAQGRKDGWTNADHYYVTPLLRLH
jgi:hypothetical protein